MRLLRPIYAHYEFPNDDLSLESYVKLLEKVTLKDDDFTRDRFLPGSAGVGALYNLLLDEMDLRER
jgi:hypothetical protein